MKCGVATHKHDDVPGCYAHELRRHALVESCGSLIPHRLHDAVDGASVAARVGARCARRQLSLSRHDARLDDVDRVPDEGCHTARKRCRGYVYR